MLNVDAAAREAAAEPDMADLREKWLSIAKCWRERQLRYSWLCSMMQKYDDFWELTTRALDATLEDHGLSSNKKIRDRLVSLYSELSPYAEVPSVLSRLKAEGQRLAVLSNASPNMLKTAMDAAGIAELFDELLSVDVLKCYKPTPSVYQLVTTRFNCEPGDVMFFSSNNWDISGAGAFGFKTIWVNRTGAPWDKLPNQPDNIVSNLVERTMS